MSNLDVRVYNTISDINEKQWNTLVNQSKLGCLFHRYEWLKAIEQGFNIKARHILVFKDSNPIGAFPNFIYKIKKTPFRELISTFPGYGGPIISVSGQKPILDLMFQKLPSFCERTIISHRIITFNLGYIRYAQYFKKKGYQLDLDLCRVIIDLTKKEDYIKEKMTKKKRNTLNRALKSNFLIKDETNIGILDDFYKSHQKMIQRIRGITIPLTLVYNIMNMMPERVKIFGLYVEGKPAGKKICILDKEQHFVYSFLSGIEESNFKYHPNELLHWHAIKWAIENGYDKYDFGLTLANFSDGIFRFKEGFDGQTVPTLIWIKRYFPLSGPIYRIGRYFYRKFANFYLS